MKKLKYLMITLLLIVTYSCQESGSDVANDDDFNIPDSLLQESESVPEISNQSMEDLVQNISSPIEMASLIKETGSKFAPEMLASTKNLDKYTTSFKKSLNLGILGADLGYLNLYSQNRFVINYLTAIKSLAEDLRVGQFFDFKTLKELASSGENLDSLTYLSVHSFNKIDQYLRENHRTNISVLIIVGVWIEGMHFTTQINEQLKIKEISDRIAEQKIILNNIILILENYKGDENFNKLLTQLKKLKEIYEPVEITYELGEPEMVEQDGILTVVQNEKSIITITEKDLENITNQIAKIRHDVIN